jgi:predicted transporter
MKDPMFRPSFLGLVYLVVGIAVAATHDYFERLNTLRLLLSALLAVLLWPLVLLGIDLHIKK